MPRRTRRTKFRDGSEVAVLKSGTYLIREHRLAHAAPIGDQPAHYDAPPPAPRAPGKKRNSRTS
ncbi:MAG TPA: hypothetical protein VN578_02255 [Candidatus Binatia bacterium]|nr:hypothetical protein [Candidatus Binatia bacterium]